MLIPCLRRVSGLPAVLAGLLLLALPGCGEQARSPDQQTAEAPDEASDLWPSARSSHAMVYHDGLQQALLLGGVQQEGAQPDTLWGWDGTRWRVLSASAPPPRAHFGLAYDAAREEVVMQGGYAGPRENITRFGDTWTWDGQAWQQAATDGPGPRDHHALVYDGARGVVVLFGGQRDDAPLGDTWTWAGRQWTRNAAEGPALRTTHRMIYDSVREQALVFGGMGADGVLNDTWAWDGAAWHPVSDGGPAPRFATRWAFDAARGEAVLFGGRSGTDLDDTWTWDGTAWTERGVAGPSMRNVHAMVYDPRRQRVVLFGGFHQRNRYADLWEWDGARWAEVARPATDS